MKKARLPAALLLAASCLILQACPPPVDYGNPCIFRGSSGNPVDPATCGLSNSGHNLIDFSATDCGDFICLRTPQGPPSGYAGGDGGCYGYCSAACERDSDCATGDSSRKLVCQAILQSASSGGGDGGTIPPGASPSYCVFASPDGG